jgi:hypothetical protein
MKKKTRSTFIGCVILAFSCLAYVACDDESSAVKEPSPDAGSRVDSGQNPTDGDAGTLPDGAPKDCFDNPKTHFEIINACTNATRITKNPTLTKLLADGGLPPLN